MSESIFFYFYHMRHCNNCNVRREKALKELHKYDIDVSFENHVHDDHVPCVLYVHDEIFCTWLNVYEHDVSVCYEQHDIYYEKQLS
jgi:hypothetical protein